MIKADFRTKRWRSVWFCWCAPCVACRTTEWTASLLDVSFFCVVLFIYFTVFCLSTRKIFILVVLVTREHQFLQSSSCTSQNHGSLTIMTSVSKLRPAFVSNLFRLWTMLKWKTWWIFFFSMPFEMKGIHSLVYQD